MNFLTIWSLVIQNNKYLWIIHSYSKSGHTIKAALTLSASNCLNKGSTPVSTTIKQSIDINNLELGKEKSIYFSYMNTLI